MTTLLTVLGAPAIFTVALFFAAYAVQPIRREW